MKLFLSFISGEPFSIRLAKVFLRNIFPQIHYLERLYENCCHMPHSSNHAKRCIHESFPPLQQSGSIWCTHNDVSELDLRINCQSR